MNPLLFQTRAKALPALYSAMAMFSSSFAFAAEKPNIILMMADDLGWGDVQCFNPDTPIKTPELDAMAAAGMQLNRFYSSSPVCSPTRGSSITGRHPFRYGVYYANTGKMKTEELTIAELLKTQGYTTGHFGKWHLGTMTTEIKDANRGRPNNTKEFSPPWLHGFDTCFSTESKVPTWDPMLKPKDFGTGSLKKGWDFIQDKSKAEPFGTHYWNEQGSIVTDNLEGDDSRVIMDRVVPFVEKAAEKQQPFFAVIWFHTPHLPVVAGPKYAAMYPDATDFEKNYNGCVTAMDEQIGRLRATLKQAGVSENTMLWFCSDNGPEGQKEAPGSAAKFKGRKRSLYEGGVRVPGILEWPAKVKAGTVTDFPAVTSDYLPTILDSIQAEYTGKRPLDGISLIPLMTGEKKERQKAIGFECKTQLAWHTQRYKLYSSNKGKSWELYDLSEDPYEKKDIAKQHPEIVTKLAAELASWRESCKQSDQGGDYQ
ncbi:sulfatase [Rubritalea spongiae]|uniref:Sulfatase n=1 Tax=Rubritalea spongiae TaxID=430797 RepID=A0ABW5E2Q5_9BACT